MPRADKQPIHCMIKEAELPIIDLHSFRFGNQTERKLIGDLARRTCETAGFFYVTNHGIDESIFLQARKNALEFFHQPQPVKSAVHISTVPHHRGYVGHFDVAPDTTKGGDIREAYKVALDLDESDEDYQAGITLYGPNIWPVDLPQFETAIYQSYLAFLELSDTIFALFATGLSLPDDYFVPMTRKPASVMNVNYYPETQPGSEISGIGAHNDYEAFAMLWQDDVGGLQIESLQGEWQAVKPVQNALVINIGELMSHWTNDRFRATKHRVINNSTRERFSLAFFGNTNYHANIQCIETCISADNPAKYPPVKAGEYLMQAIKRTYAYAQDS
ncbi:MAG: isopenicillin N synthase-like dioxygenase [Parasphingorhabdus sp.]|jgi:isopenicillin N synthase-like dioxygenase